MNTKITDNIYENNNELIAMTTLSHLISSKFYIATSSIFDLLYQINEWLMAGVCGAMIYGRSRIGKTTALTYIVEALHKKYGDDFPVIIWSLTEHSTNKQDKAFYANILDAIGVDITIYNRVTALELKNRVINYFSIKAAATPFRKIVLMIDEAYKLEYKEYYWLMDIYNTLHIKYNIQLTVFLVGTPIEMLSMREAFKKDRKTQIVERFMLNDFVFKGICSRAEITLCLAELDKACILTGDNNNPNITLSEFFFPNAFAEEKASFLEIAGLYWEAFAEIKLKYGIETTDIPMQYFMQSFINCLSGYGIASNNSHFFITKEDITEAIERTGYGRTTSDY